MKRLAAGALVLGTLAVAGIAVAVAGTGAGRARLTVYAASSLVDALPAIDHGERYQFAGSNMLAAQIEQGAPADVFAAANTKLPAELHAKGLCSRPVVFTRNALVLIVPTANHARVTSVFNLRKHGVKVVVAGAGVPAGSYTLRALQKLHLASRVLPNVVSRETDVREVLAKVALGEADAGFVYATDAKAAPRKVKVLRLPAKARPNVAYAACVVTASAHQADARAFVGRLVGRAGQARLGSFGFLAR